MHACLGPCFLGLLAPLLPLLRQLAQHRAAPCLAAEQLLVSTAHLDQRNTRRASNKQALV